MRSGMRAMIASLLVLATVQTVHAVSISVGEPTPLGPRGLARRMERNAEIAKYVALRGYPDWAEEVEVDSSLPLDTHEVRLYYLRLNREVGFTRAYILDKPRIGLKSYERPMVAEKRAWIQSVYLAHDPALRAELAAERAMAAAERAEQGAVSVENAVAKAERISSEMERAFHRRLRK